MVSPANGGATEMSNLPTVNMRFATGGAGEYDEDTLDRETETEGDSFDELYHGLRDRDEDARRLTSEIARCTTGMCRAADCGDDEGLARYHAELRAALDEGVDEDNDPARFAER